MSKRNSAITESHLVFWSRQLSEHALFAHLGLVNEDLKIAAANLHEKWEKFRENLDEDSDEHDERTIKHFNKIALQQKDFQINILKQLTNITKNTDGSPHAWLGWLDPSFLEHITRELNYAYAKVNRESVFIEDEVNFWRIINKEHALFAAHLLDPSEKDLIQTAYKLASDISSGRTCESKFFVEASIHDISKLDKYNRTAKTLLNKNQIRSIIHPVLLTHIIREGQRALYIINKIDNKYPDTNIDKDDNVFDDFSKLEENKDGKQPESVLKHK